MPILVRAIDPLLILLCSPRRIDDRKDVKKLTELFVAAITF